MESTQNHRLTRLWGQLDSQLGQLDQARQDSIVAVLDGDVFKAKRLELSIEGLTNQVELTKSLLGIPAEVTPVRLV